VKTCSYFDMRGRTAIPCEREAALECFYPTPNGIGRRRFGIFRCLTHLLDEADFESVRFLLEDAS